MTLPASRLVLAIILFEIVFICILLYFILHKRNRNPSVNPIARERVVISANKTLKYFYEPIPNEIQNIEKSWLKKPATITINADALNERFDYPEKKQPLSFRILALGDSFTFGDNISTTRNWVERLEDELNSKYKCQSVDKYEVINLGMSGYDTEYELERYKRRGVKYHPDIVLWTFGDLSRFKEQVYDLEERIKKEDKEKILEEEIRYYGKKSVEMTEYSEIIIDVAMRRVARNMSTAEKIIRNKIYISELNNIYNGKIVYFDINYSDDALLSGIFSEITIPGHRYFKKFINLTEDMRLEDYHFNDKGHKQMMENVLTYLLSNKLIPCGASHFNLN